jgi:hypothetical protein
MREIFCPSGIYIRAEPRENIVHLLSLLRVSRQIYREARLLPFSCNVWFCYGRFRRLSEEQRQCIEWVGFEIQRIWYGRPPERLYCSENSKILSDILKDLSGVKGFLRKTPMHEDDEEVIARLAKYFGCELVDEERAPLTGEYMLI